MAHVHLADEESAFRMHRDDAKSSAIVDIVIALDRFLASKKPSSQLGPLLRGVARKASLDVVRDEIRHKARLRRKFGSDLPEAQDYAVCHDHVGDVSKDSSPWTLVGINRSSSRPQIELTEQQAKEAILAKVPQEFHQVVLLKMEGLTSKEVAERLGLSQSKVCRILDSIRDNF